MTFYIMIWLSGFVIGYAMHDYWRWSAIRAALRLASGEEQ